VRYLEPGKKRRPRRPSLNSVLWATAAVMAVALAFLAVLR
jgi:hypothetical protein